MSDYNDRINYITRYFSILETNIRLSNKAFLYDEAKHYEQFALKMCELWFNKGFRNLNSERPNFPYVDLASEDCKTVVQVTTENDPNTKIKETLNDISYGSNSNLQIFTDADELYFFILDTEKIGNIKNYSGEKQIGRFSFSKDKNLITTSTLLKRAEENESFQKKLYEALQNYGFYPNVKRVYSFDVEGYLERTVYETDLDSEYDLGFLNNPISLKEALTKDKKIVLLADAAVGKSTELRYLAALLSECDGSFPVFVDLNQYTGGSIKTVITDYAPEYAECNPKYLTLIMDSYDELSHRNDFEKELIKFLSKFPAAKVCISMRSSFYNSSLRAFGDFKIYRLRPFSTSNIADYLSIYEINKTDFLFDVVGAGLN